MLRFPASVFDVSPRGAEHQRSVPIQQEIADKGDQTFSQQSLLSSIRRHHDFGAHRHCTPTEWEDSARISLIGRSECEGVGGRWYVVGKLPLSFELIFRHRTLVGSRDTVSSRIVLAQTFYNSSDEPTGNAKYVFPLPANAAVCAFELELGDGSVVIGEVMEKEEAALTFTRAVEQGKTTALVERVTDDSKPR